MSNQYTKRKSQINDVAPLGNPQTWNLSPILSATPDKTVKYAELAQGDVLPGSTLRWEASK